MSRFLVIGDVILDHYVYGRVSRISPEAPVPVVDLERETWELGGGANVANNLVCLGEEVVLTGIVGTDKNGVLLKSLLKSKGIIDLVYSSATRSTTTKSRVISVGQQLLRLDSEDIRDIDDGEERGLLKCLIGEIDKIDCIILSDYNKGVLIPRFVSQVMEIAGRLGIKVLVDPKSPPFSKYFGAFLIKPNRREAKLETGIHVGDIESFKRSALAIMKSANCNNVVITLSEDGVGLFNESNCMIFPTEAKEVFDVTGAGDTFIATLAFGITLGYSVDKACALANFASGIVVGKNGCVPINISELQNFIKT